MESDFEGDGNFKATTVQPPRKPHAKIRQVRKWPHDLRLEEVRVLLSPLQEGDTFFVDLQQVVGFASLAIIPPAVAISPALMVGSVLGVGAANRLLLPAVDKLRPGTVSHANGALSHFFLTLRFCSTKEDSTYSVTLERTANAGVILFAGESSRPMVAEGMVVDLRGKRKTISLEYVLKFCDVQDDIEYNTWKNNCKHTTYAFLSQIVGDSTYASFKTFRNAMHRAFRTNLKKMMSGEDLTAEAEVVSEVDEDGSWC